MLNRLIRLLKHTHKLKSCFQVSLSLFEIYDSNLSISAKTMMMTCSVSGRVPVVPVVSKTSGLLFEKEVIEKHIRDVGKCPITGDSLTMDDIIAINKSPQFPDSVAEDLEFNKISLSQIRTPEFPDSIIEDIEFNKICLSQIRRRRHTKISTSLATVDTLRGYIFNEGYALHRAKTPGVLSLDIDNSMDIIATGGADSNAVVLDLSSRKTLYTLSGHSEKVTTLKFVNKGEMVVTGSGDNTVRVWKMSEKGSYECNDILRNHTAEVQSVTIHPSQKYFVSASLDCTWQFYDLSSESRVAQVTCCTGDESLSTAVFHPDGHIFGTCASGLGVGVVRFWDAATQDDIMKIDNAHSGQVTSLAFSENGYTLATAAVDGVKLWDLRFLRNMKTFPSDDTCTQTRSVDFDYSGKYLATGGAACIRIYEIAAGSDPITTISPLSGIGDLSCVKFGKDARYVAAARRLDSKLLFFGPSKRNDSCNC